MTPTKPTQTVFVLGGTGQTGSSVVNGLLESGKYRVIVGVRPTSRHKPEALKFEERGVEIRAVELSYSPVDLDTALKGVDIVISTTFATEIDNQTRLVDAAKRVGVKRFIPSDWAAPCVRGVRGYYDQKVAVQDYIKSVGLGYTFVDVGVWAAESFPEDREESEEDTPLPSKSHKITGSGDVKNATTALQDVGRFVAEIIDDERTLNQYVFVWGEEVSQNELWELARKVKADLGLGPLKAKPRYETAEEVIEKEKKAAKGSYAQLGYEYLLSLYIRGDNTLENAKKPEYGGALDARELYPHIRITSMEEVAKAVYGK